MEETKVNIEELIGCNRYNDIPARNLAIYKELTTEVVQHRKRRFFGLVPDETWKCTESKDIQGSERLAIRLSEENVQNASYLVVDSAGQKEGRIITGVSDGYFNNFGRGLSSMGREVDLDLDDLNMEFIKILEKALKASGYGFSKCDGKIISIRCNYLDYNYDTAIPHMDKNQVLSLHDVMHLGAFIEQVAYKENLLTEANNNIASIFEKAMKMKNADTGVEHGRND